MSHAIEAAAGLWAGEPAESFDPAISEYARGQVELIFDAGLYPVELRQDEPEDTRDMIAAAVRELIHEDNVRMGRRMKTPQQIADTVITSRYILECDDTPESALSDEIHDGVLYGPDIRDLMIEAVEADRAQRRLIFTAPGGWRCWTETPAEVYAQIQQALEVGHALEELGFEA